MNWKMKAIEEHTVLRKKIEKLDIFIEENEEFWLLGSDARNRLRDQLDYMTKYADKLQERLNND